MSQSALAGLAAAGVALAAGLGPAPTLAATPAGGALGEPAAPAAETAGPTPADRLQAALAPPLAALVAEVLARNPEVARARAAAAAAGERAPQARAWPDPTAALAVFLEEPEAEVAPQRLAATLSQRVPWFGKLALREREALLIAAAARAEVEARRLDLVTETRRQWYELVFLGTQEAVVEADRATLVRYEELARARYASGVGLGQAVVKIQAEITQDDHRLLEIAGRRAELVAGLNALRDRPHTAPVSPVPEAPPPLPPAPPGPALRLEALESASRDARPELARARALIAAAEAGVELAEKAYRPDLTLGLEYTLRDRPRDPSDSSDEGMLGLMVGVDLPVRRRRLAAGVAEAAARRTAAEEELRSVAAGIDHMLGELVERIPLARRQLALFDDLLVVQAEEALRSAEAAYASGAVGALELLDAERVLLEVEVAAARTHADYLILLARLEGEVGAPLADLSSGDAP
jgi:outer membrane protein TolC